MEQSGFSSRLRELAEGFRSENAFAASVGVSGTMMRKYLSGSEPGVAIAARIAQSTGVRLDWLILGEGPKFESDREPNETSRASLDPDLLGRVVDRIARVYRELGIGLPDVQLGQLAAEKYAEIQAFTADRDEWPPALDLMAVRLRKALLQAAAEPGSTKSRA